MAQRLDDRWVVSPQDVVAEFECPHRVALGAAVQSGALTWEPTPDEALELLQRQGVEHERFRLKQLQSRSSVVELPMPTRTHEGYQAAWEATQAAMNSEVDAIYQATLYTGDFLGFADFLIIARDDHGAIIRDEKGQAIYEPVDAKSARVVKTSAALQVGCYAETLARLGCPAPRRVHLWLGGDEDWIAEAAPFVALARRIRQRLSARMPELGAAPVPDWAPPREACLRCRFADLCDVGRHRDRDLSMVQGIRSDTRGHLVDAGIPTIDALAATASDDRPARVSPDSFERLRAQAALQLAGEQAGTILHEVVSLNVLAGLPNRSPGDLWFDIEGDPYAPGPHGLEYMFGFGFLDGETFKFDTTEADSPSSEKVAFEEFIDLVMRRWAEHPGMHVYHYADYERRTLQRLAQQHETREDEVDRILQAGILIDLYTVVRRALRVSTESLSLKYIEGLYGVTHSGEDVSTAMDSVIQYERVVALREQGDLDAADALLGKIRSYNELDCESTKALDDWLRTLIPMGADGKALGVDVSSMDPERTERLDPFADLLTALRSGLPEDPSQRSPTDTARALLAAALMFHPRERRPAWWALFELIMAEAEDLRRDSDVLVADSIEASEWGLPPRARKPRRELVISSATEDPRMILSDAGDAFLLYETAAEGMPSPSDSDRGYHPGDIQSVSDDSVVITERSGHDNNTWPHTPIAVLPGPPPSADAIRKAIAGAAQSVVPTSSGQGWDFPQAAWADLLLGRAPRLTGGQLPRTGNDINDVCSALLDCEDSYVAVQGPPGTGKTYVGSRAVARLAQQGWKIGVVAQSHSVVDNFLDAVRGADALVALGKEPGAKRPATQPWHITGKLDAWALGQTGGYVVGGTAWTFSREAVHGLGLDLLVVDEAAQFALANAVACAWSARNVLLLGDPQQLPQVTQAAHPEEMESSVLQCIIGAHAIMPTDRGYFLDQTYRMSPALTNAVSDLQYEGRLLSAPVTSLRHLDGVSPGVIPLPIEHRDNTTASPQEAAAVVDLVRELIGRSWTPARDDQAGVPRPLEPSDIIIVAAFNAQVRLLRRELNEAGFGLIQVGTVDKFQGREEVVVLVSMATSSAEDLPRGIDFLLSPNRLNVAISRAQWACFLVHSPALLDSSPSSATGMERLGRFIELIEAPVDA